MSESGQVIHDLMKTADSQRVSSASLEDVKALRQKALKSKSCKLYYIPTPHYVFYLYYVNQVWNTLSFICKWLIDNKTRNVISWSKYLFYLILPWEEVPRESCNYYLHAYNTLVTVFDSVQKKIANRSSEGLILIVSGKTGPFPGQEMVNPPRKNGNENYQSITDPFSGIRIMWVHLSSS